MGCPERRSSLLSEAGPRKRLNMLQVTELELESYTSLVESRLLPQDPDAGPGDTGFGVCSGGFQSYFV